MEKALEVNDKARAVCDPSASDYQQLVSQKERLKKRRKEMRDTKKGAARSVEMRVFRTNTIVASQKVRRVEGK